MADCQNIEHAPIIALIILIFLSLKDWGNLSDKMSEMIGCRYLYHTGICSMMSEEMNYETLIDYQSTRLALHTGDLEYSPFSGVNFINIKLTNFLYERRFL
jgi:hypothetical protein